MKVDRVHKWKSNDPESVVDPQQPRQSEGGDGVPTVSLDLNHLQLGQNVKCPVTVDFLLVLSGWEKDTIVLATIYSVVCPGFALRFLIVTFPRLVTIFFLSSLALLLASQLFGFIMT